VLFAFGGNVSPVNYSILGEYFGRTVFARLRGALGAIGVIGGLTPVYAGWIFDKTDSYSIVLMTFSGLAAAAAFLLLLMKNPQRHISQMPNHPNPQ
ncbi:MAG: Nitrate/nitrite transporter NarK, partial [Chloroflexi bacterium]